MKKLIVLTLSLVAMLSAEVSALAQQSLSGTVVSGQEPVVGALVYIQGTRTGTVTDVDGHFAITAKEGSVLCIECLGFKTVLVTVEKNRMDYLVELETDSQMLEDVVSWVTEA